MNANQTHPASLAPQRETVSRNDARFFRWTLAATGAAAAMLLVALIGGNAGAKDPVQVTIRPDATAAIAAAAVGADDKPEAGTGTFKGVVTFKGTPPKPKVDVVKGDPKVKPEDRAICAASDLPSDELLVNEKKENGVANVFVYLRKAPDGYTPPPVPKDPVVFDQKGCRFIPHALTVRCKQTVLIKSDDDLVHNTHTNPVTNTKGFNQAIKPKDRDGVMTVYDKPERVPVKVNCDFHPWMKAWHLPLDHPFMAVTDADGKFEIKGLPPGKYTFFVWHEIPGYLNNKLAVEINADKVTEEKLSYTPAQFKVGS
jgi:hypothetical protein